MISTFLSGFILLWLLSSSCHALPSSSFQPWGIVRGGSQQDHTHQHDDLSLEASSLPHYVVVSTLVVPLNRTRGHDDSTLEPGCMLISSNTDGDLSPLWRGRGLWKENSLALWHSLALLSDVIVLVLETKSLPVDLMTALVAGYRQRRSSAGLPPGKLLILLHDDTFSFLSQSLLFNLDKLTPDLVQLEIAPVSSFSSVFQQMLLEPTEQHGISGMINAMAFPELLHQVFQSKGGHFETALLEEQRPNAHPTIGETEYTTDDNQESNALTEHDLEIIRVAEQSLEEVQSRQEENWLNPGSLPTDFAGMVNPILEQLDSSIKTSQAKSLVEKQVGLRVRELHQQHVKDLRDYYGSMYETLLDQNIDDPSAWHDAAERVSAAFRKAAQDSIPVLAREGGVFRDMDLEYVTAFSGLLSDMKEATELRQQEDTSLLDDEEPENSVEKRKRLPKWLEKVAARALVLGVNYLQGWLAWQGVRRAALERERNMPKFPLF